ncbi:AAA family ATPase, partial [Candidatus Saccharibacteria bacterium]|nr:AAA family ATPase [Candidatus Saccharibacteria bacterium]
MKIVQLTAENVKKLKVVRIRPDGSLVVIGGKNGQGKSSVLECIMAALGGKKHVLPEAVREGEKKGYTELDLDNGISIKRTFTKDGGGQLTITNKEEGTSYSSPQAMLDKIVGKISFDPLMFARAGEKEQLEFLRHLTGLDFSEL